MLDLGCETKVFTMQACFACITYVSCSLDKEEKFNVALFSLATVIPKKLSSINNESC